MGSFHRLRSLQYCLAYRCQCKGGPVEKCPPFERVTDLVAVLMFLVVILASGSYLAVIYGWQRPIWIPLRLKDKESMNYTLPRIEKVEHGGSCQAFQGLTRGNLIRCGCPVIRVMVNDRQMQPDRYSLACH
ncbi:hypothetical protein B0H17DRAFT_1130147 [Mycena rosella]|uniref:Uncharacterized protein n=1 Tax=Mycena rosella TaxID=1033263 RepID=A0AAD7GJG0_MYCRO|nr:hypothetical protein B0H17DRAFT_1130147 [Mycena rosella]